MSEMHDHEPQSHEPQSHEPQGHELQGHEPQSPIDIAAVHACFTAIVEGRMDERITFPSDVQAAAQALADRHAELEYRAALSIDPARCADANTIAANDTNASAVGRSLAIGTQVGAFTIAEFLGHGATGEVYRAVQTSPSREVALKMLFPEFADGHDLHRESEMLASLEHPSIARLYQTGEYRVGPLRRHWIAMQFVRGKRTLADWSHSLDLARPSTVLASIRMMIAIADATAFAHGRGVIHRDLKPSNILVDPDENPVLIDFGVAKLLAFDPQRTMHVLGPRIVGTLAYAAPESLDLGSPPDVRVDVFALGAMLFELLTQQPFRTFQAHTLAGMLHELHSPDRSPQRLATVNRAFYGDLDRIVAKATATDPRERYASASQFAEDLRRHLAGEPVLAELQSPRERFMRAARRHRRAATLGASIAVLLLATTSVALTFAHSARHEARLANLSAAARAIDAGDLMLVEQHASALGESDGSIERAIIDRAIQLRGEVIADGDWYGVVRAGPTAVLAVGYPPGTTDGPILARFERDTPPESTNETAWRRVWSTTANRTVTNTVAITDDGTHVVAVDVESGLVVLDAKSGEVRAAIPRTDAAPNSCAITVAPNGTIAVARNKVELRSINEPERIIAALDPEIGSLRAVAFSPADPTFLAVAGHGGAVLLAHSDAGLRVVTRFDTPPANQVTLRWTSDGTRLAIGGWDRTVRLYEPLKPRALWTARGHHDAIWSIDIDARDNSTRMLTASADGSLRLWRIEDGSLIAAMPFSNDIVWSIAAAADGSLATASQGALSIAEAKARDAWIGSGSVDPLSRTGRSLRIEPSSPTRPEARLSEIVSGVERSLPPIPGDGAVSRVAIAPDDSTALLLREDGTLSLIEIEAARVRWSTTALRSDDIHEPQGISSLALDGKNGNAIVASRQFGCIALDARDGREQWRRAIGASCTDVAASPDGTRIFAADRDGLLVALDARSGKELASTRRQRTRVSCMAVTDDGARLVTGGADGSLRVLDTRTLEAQLMLQISSEQLRSLWIHESIIHAVDRAGVLRIR